MVVRREVMSIMDIRCVTTALGMIIAMGVIMTIGIGLVMIIVIGGITFTGMVVVLIISIVAGGCRFLAWTS